MFLLRKGQIGEASLPPKQQCSFGYRRALERKVNISVLMPSPRSVTVRFCICVPVRVCGCVRAISALKQVD